MVAQLRATLYHRVVTERTRELLQEALRLSTQERAELAAELLSSVDGEPDEGVEAAWAAEIERRAGRAERGESIAEDWEIAKARLLAKYKR